LTLSQIATKFHSSASTIRKYLINFKIKIRPSGFQKNHRVFRKNFKHSKESKRKIAKSLKGKSGSLSRNWNGGLPICTICGLKTKDYNSSLCRQCWKNTNPFSGINNPNYVDGQGNAPYPTEFNDKLKEKIRNRDSFICQHCGLYEDDHFRGNKHINLTIHHIDYNCNNCCNLNLITLCNSCNVQANHNRDYYFSYYRYIIDNKIFMEV